MRGLPEPGLSIVRGLQAENPFVPLRIMDETYVLDPEVSLSFFPFFRPSQVGFVELLPQFRDFNRIGRWKEKFVSHRLTHHHALSLSRTIHRVDLTAGTSQCAPYISKIGYRRTRFNQSARRIRRKIIPL
jgi:hypothetical protein